MDGDVKLGKSLIKNFHDLSAYVYLYMKKTKLARKCQMKTSETVNK